MPPIPSPLLKSFGAYQEIDLPEGRASGFSNVRSFRRELKSAAAGASVTAEDGKAVVKSPAVEKQMDGGIQLIKPIDIEAGKNYRLKFKADAGKRIGIV